MKCIDRFVDIDFMLRVDVMLMEPKAICQCDEEGSQQSAIKAL